MAKRPPYKNEAPRAKPKTGAVHLFGCHAVAAAWLNPERACHRLLLTESGKRLMDGALMKAPALRLTRPKPEIMEGRALDKMLPPGAVHQGIMLEADSLPEKMLDDVLASAEGAASSCFLMLDQVTDPHNVGAILRSACAFGVGAVLMTDRHAAAATGTLAKIASGALEHTPLVRVSNLAQALGQLQKAGYWCIGLDESGALPLHEIKMPAKTVLVLGAEGEGLRRLTRESCDEIARLPTVPPVGSLNVSNAAAVAIYEVKRQWN